MTLFHAQEALGKSTLKSYDIMANNPTHCEENERHFYVQNHTAELSKDTESAVHTAPAFRKELDETLLGISRAEICHPNVGQIWEGRNVFIHEDTIRTSVYIENKLYNNGYNPLSCLGSIFFQLTCSHEAFLF